MAKNIIEYIQKKLLELKVSYLKSNGSQVLVRCPFCEDSIKNPYHAHFYIGFLENGTIVYDCKKCPASGKMSKEVMHKLGIEDTNIDKYLDSKQSFSINKKINFDNQLFTDWKIPTKIEEKDLKKVLYFESRTGIKVTRNTINEYKIILNLMDFFTLNKIDYLSDCSNKKEAKYKQSLIEDLSNSYIGVMSFNKNTIQMRNIDSKINKKRYFNYTINKSIKAPMIYMPTSSVDLMASNPKIHMAEGFFDIICVKNKFFPENDSNNIFCATGSKGSYGKALATILKMTGWLDAKLTIFSDKDVKLDEYSKNIFNLYKDMLKINVYYNTPFKDFGHQEHLIFDEEKYPDHRIEKFIIK